MTSHSVVFALLATGALLAPGTGSAADATHLRVLKTYTLGGQDTGYDYLRFDPTAHRLFIAHATRVEVIDADTGKRLGEIADTPGVHGIALAPELGRGFTSNGRGRSVTMFDLQTLKPLSVIKYTGVKPDAIEYDADSHRVFVVNGGDTGDVSVIDPQSGAIVGTVALGADKLEEIQFDGHGRAFVNDEGKSVVHVFDTHKLTPIATWSVAPGEAPTGLALDPLRHRLFSACGNNKLVVLDSETGKVIATAPIGEDPDGAAFDPKTNRILVSNRDGTLSVLDGSAGDRYPTLQTVKTEKFARTITLDDRNGRAYLPTATFNPPPPATADKQEARPVMIPQTFRVLVVGE